MGGGDHEQFRRETSDLTVDRVRLISERVRFEGGHPSVTQATTEIDEKRGLGVVEGKRPILSAKDASRCFRKSWQRRLSASRNNSVKSAGQWRRKRSNGFSETGRWINKLHGGTHASRVAPWLN